MTEYWVSKKQYWCKYCNIFVRDDAPSRRLHETGLKHLGSKERYIRDLYKHGDMAKREKAEEAAEMAKIEASAAAAYAVDSKSGSPSVAARESILQRIAAAAASKASSSRLRDNKPKEKWANYSTAEQLGFDDADTQKSNYEIEQEIKGRAGEVGKWEEVAVEPVGLYTGDDDGNDDGLGSSSGGASGLGKRKWPIGSISATAGDAEEGEDFKIVHNRRAPDPYDDDWDPSTLKSLKVRVKEERKFRDTSGAGSADVASEPVGGLKREGWTGKLELRPVGSTGDGGTKREGMRFDSTIGGWVKREAGDGDGAENKATGNEDDVDLKPDLTNEKDVDVKPLVDNDSGPVNLQVKVIDSSAAALTISPPIVEPDAGEAATASSSLFKKRRPPPSSRKK